MLHSFLRRLFEMAREYHVTYGISKRILNLKEDDNLTKVITETFNIAPEEFFIQKWDSEWDDWIDISDVGDLPLCAKLKVEVKHSFSSHSFDDAANSSTQTVDTSITMDDCTDSRSDLLIFFLNKF